MKRLLFAFGLVVAAWLPTPAQDPLPPAPAATPITPRRFEVATIGSGAPEVLVWFGAATPDEAQLKFRRALAEAYRRDFVPGSGRVHLVVDLGPSGDESCAFDADFPSVLGSAGPADCLTRADAGALAAYLVAHPALVGMLRLEPGAPVESPDLLRETLQQTDLKDRSLQAFRYVGLGLTELRAGVALADPGQPEPFAGARFALDEALLMAHVQLRPAVLAVTQLGGELWQLDLLLQAPDLSPVRPDPARIYPRARLHMAVTPAESQALLVELAWRRPDATTYERLATREGAFAFPDGSLPSGATLRLVVRVPAAAAETGGVEVSLDAGRAGIARCRLDLSAP